MTMSETYMDANTQTVSDTTASQHGGTDTSNMDVSNVKAAAVVIGLALALLWLFGGVVFRTALR